MTFQPPQPFTPHTRTSPLTAPWEPIYADVREDRWVLGLEAREAHANSLGVDYLAAPALGQWLEFDTDFIKPGKSLCYAEATVRADGKPVARARGTFKVV